MRLKWYSEFSDEFLLSEFYVPNEHILDYKAVCRKYPKVSPVDILRDTYDPFVQFNCLDCVGPDENCDDCSGTGKVPFLMYKPCIEVVNLAKYIKQTGDFSCAGVLVDALKEDGCEEECIFAHLLGSEICPGCQGKGGEESQESADGWQKCMICWGEFNQKHFESCWAINVLLEEDQTSRRV